MTTFSTDAGSAHDGGTVMNGAPGVSDSTAVRLACGGKNPYLARCRLADRGRDSSPPRREFSSGGRQFGSEDSLNPGIDCGFGVQDDGGRDCFYRTSFQRCQYINKRCSHCIAISSMSVRKPRYASGRENRRDERHTGALRQKMLQEMAWRLGPRQSSEAERFERLR